MPLARQLAARYRHAGEPLEDLIQVACMGLIKAVDRYDPERGNGFTRYAVPTMLGEIKRHFRDKGWSVHVPRATQELVLKVGEALGDLPSRLGRSPTARDIAAAVNAPVEDVLEAMEAATAYEAVSLDAPRPGTSDEESIRKAEKERKDRKYSARAYERFPPRFWMTWLDDKRGHLFVQEARAGAKARDLAAQKRLEMRRGT